jgi:nitrogen fixation NifU-like protein
MYSAQVLDHFQNPRNAGDVENADVHIRMENPACGDVLELSARFVSDHIEEVRFRAKGCVSAMACASALTELLQGTTIATARKLRREDVVEKVGGLPEASAHAAYLAIDALQALLKNR